MILRWLESIVGDPSLGPQMRFIAGPRQCGKTTLARAVLAAHGAEDRLYNLDTPEVRRRFRSDPLFYRADLGRERRAWACFDEIHKQRRWKDVLKGIYDAEGERLTLLVTGSARLDLLRRAGDSLAGRFFLFRLLPVAIGELRARPRPAAPRDVRAWIEDRIDPRRDTKEAREAFEALLRFGAFPEPLVRGEARFHALWRRSYVDAVVRGDLRDLSRVRELDTVEALIDMLPHRVGSPLSINSLREDLDVSHPTVQRMVHHLERLFVVFHVLPWVRRLARPVKREKKCYLFEWSAVEEPGPRFENLVALELLALAHLWTDSGEGRFEVRFVRDRAGKETDFLLVREGKPWCLVECRLHVDPIEAHHRRFAAALGGIPVVQLLRQSGVLQAADREAVSVSASRFLG